MMLLTGRIWKDMTWRTWRTWWLAEVPMLDVITQGKTRREAVSMLKDAIESLVNKGGFSVRVVDRSVRDEVAIESDDVATLFAMALKRLREANGLSMADVAKALGQSSKNAYARYEQGKTVPTIKKAEELLRVVSPADRFAISIAARKR
jgi:DNA-binding transcriptional regulator YiaG